MPCIIVAQSVLFHRFPTLIFQCGLLSSMKHQPSPQIRPCPTRLAIQGDHFVFNGQHVFLSGGNLAWIYYGYDLGNNQWSSVKGQVDSMMSRIRKEGGNSLRLWIHIQGENTPMSDNNGYVICTDNQGTFLNDFKDMLDLARSHNILVFPTLWNAAVDQDYSHRLDGLIRDHRKLQTYLDKVLTPLVKAVKCHPALGAWDIINEPEGMIIPNLHHSDKCFDTTKLHNSGAGWAGHKYNYQDMLRFINWQAAAIKAVDPRALVTVGVWNPKSNTDQFNFVDHYTDSCLFNAGGKQLGKLDFYQFHSYAWKGKFDDVAAFNHSAGDYAIGKPIVVGEFWEEEGGGMTIEELFAYVYNHGYAGAWSWDLRVLWNSQKQGIHHISGYTSNGKIPINIP